MFHNMLLGRYYPERSKIHAMNPIAKLLCIFIFMISALLSTSWQFNIFLMILTVLFLLLTNIPLVHYLRTTKALIPIYMVMLIMGILFHISLFNSFLLMIRITSILFHFIMLTLTTPMTEMIYGFEMLFGFLKVFGFNVSSVALSITETIRFIPNLVDEGNRILKSATSRGIDYRNSNIVTKFMILKSMSSSIFELTIKKSEDLKFAMSLRLYQKGPRTNFRMNRWKVFDSYMITLYLLVLLVIIKKEIMG